MTAPAIDTSAIMAIVLDERGRDVAARRAPGGILSSVNFAEIITKCVEKAVPPQIAQDYIRNSNIEVVEFDAEHAILAGELFKVAKKGILSLGDRACLASAMRLNVVALTADRVWSTLDLPCQIELIR